MFSFFRSKDPYSVFWNWFSKNESSFYNFELNPDLLLGEMYSKLESLQPGLTFEIGPIVNGVREFVISADGVKKYFPVVQQMVNNSPKLDRWKIVAFRQPRILTEITMENVTLKIDDTYFIYGKDNGFISVKLFMNGYQKSSIWTNLSFVLLDSLLGEYDTEMLISKIEREALDTTKIHELYPIKVLPQVLQSYRLEYNN